MSPASRWPSSALGAVIVLLAMARFVNIEADFPAGITDSGALLTDEGWYTHAAVHHTLDGRWHLAGDFNPIVNMPVGQLIQAAVFSVFDISLTVARTTTACCFLLLVISTYCLARCHVTARVASWIALLLAANYFLFAYSRLALLDIMMIGFITASLAVASAFRSANHLPVTLGSSLILVLAVLTKSTAVFALPLLMYLLSTRADTPRHKLVLAAASGLVCVAIVTAYNLLASHFYPEDFSYFRDINFESRLPRNPFRAGRRMLKAVEHAQMIAPIVYPVALFGSALLAGSKDFRRNVLTRLSVLWLIVYFGLLSFVSYHPPRYFLPLAIPVVILFCLALQALCQRLDRRLALPLATVVLASTLSLDGYQALSYSMNPEFSFVAMARDVERRIEGAETASERPVLIGHFANSISLETGIRSLNSSLGTHDVDWKIERYRPDYYITVGREPVVEQALDRHYRRQKIAQWDVYGDIYTNRRVLLFRLHERAD